ncbi:MAG TPA: V-type ATP synthase subunit F [Thermoplasmata archaeon]
MEIAAVGRDDFVQGFKLVGVRRAVATTKEEIERKLAEILDDPEVGILVLDTADMKGLSHSMRRRLETVARPVVIAVGAAEDEDLRTKVRRAIGVDLFK